MFRNRYSIWSAVAACASVLLLAAATTSKGNGTPIAPDDEDTALPQVAVIPFLNSDEKQESTGVGFEIADELTHSLNRMKGFAVLPQDILRDQARSSGAPDAALKLPDAILVAKKLGVSTLVTGAYKRSGSKIDIDCAVVDVATGQTEEAKSFSLSGEYQTGYASLLRDLPQKVESILSPPAATDDPPKPAPSPGGSTNTEAHDFYSAGLQKADVDSSESLTTAKESFKQALAKDPTYAQAYVAKADAETRLAALKDKKGLDASQDKADALSDAMEACKQAPYFGGAHLQLSRTLTMTGDYKGAELAARVAAQLWPADSAVFVDLSRAIGQGHILDGPEIKTAVKMTPAEVLVVPEMPKVTLLNGGEADLQVTFIEGGGRVFTSLQVPGGSARIVGLVSGKYTVKTVGGGTVKTETCDFGPGTVYALDGRTLVAETPDKQPAEKTGPATLVVTCDVMAAQVYVNDKRVGTTPLEWVVDSSIAPDWLFKIEVRAGDLSYKREYHVASGARVRVRAALKSKATTLKYFYPGRLDVISTRPRFTTCG